MNVLDHQHAYWDKAAQEKNFTHPLQIERFRNIVPRDGVILDYGCGYGRTCAFLKEHGFGHVVGVDISSEMIARGLRLDSRLDLRQLEREALPFDDNTFDACTMMAVLNCIPTDNGQQTLMDELHRVLRTGGILYLSDYPLQSDDKNTRRYRRFEKQFEKFGVFQLPDGAVLRHHDMDWIYHLLEPFEIFYQEKIDVRTMNNNKAVIFQIMAVKK